MLPSSIFETQIMSKLQIFKTLVSLVALSILSKYFPMMSSTMMFDKTCELLESGPALAACNKLVVEMKAKLTDAISPASRLDCCGRHYMIECMQLFYQKCGTWNQTAAILEIDASYGLDVSACSLPDSFLNSMICIEDWVCVWSCWVLALILVVLVQVLRRKCLYI